MVSKKPQNPKTPQKPKQPRKPRRKIISQPVYKYKCRQQPKSKSQTLSPNAFSLYQPDKTTDIIDIILILTTKLPQVQVSAHTVVFLDSSGDQTEYDAINHTQLLNGPDDSALELYYSK